MSDTLRVLGIAPYENMKNLMEAVSQEYPQIELTLFVGDRDRGLEIARQNFHGNYDVVISRGGTASLLRQYLALPVIEIEISSYDLLCSLKLAGGLHRRVWFICADNVAGNARQLKEVMGLDLEIVVYETREEAQAAVRRFQPRGDDVLLCDMVAYTIAKTMGLIAYMIMSGTENIRRAFDQAMLLGRSRSLLQDENIFLRELLRWQIGYTTILDGDGNIYLSTLEPIAPDFLELLRRELPECLRTPERRITRSLNSSLYVIRTRRIFIGSVAYTAFFYDIRRTPLGSSYTGIRAYTRPEVEERYCRGVFSTSGYLSDAQERLEHIIHSPAPVMILGEAGTGKESAVDILTLQGPLRNNPQFHINCAALGEKEWAFLMEHHNSPLADDGGTLYFIHVDAIPQERCRRLIAVLQDMRVCSRNRVIFSCVCPEGGTVAWQASELAEKLCCLTLELPPLRSLSSRIPQMVNMYISRLNEDMPAPLLGAEPEALRLLQQYNWPHNFAQFRRILSELAITASGQMLTVASVRELLRRERHIGSFAAAAGNADAPLDLTRPLEEINREIVRRVVEESGGNQTAAAKRLGISRTTLWRMIQTEGK